MEPSVSKKRKTTKWKSVAKTQAQHALDALRNADQCAQEAAHWKSVAAINGRIMWAAVTVAGVLTLALLAQWATG